jgi:hypothetical protein
MPVRLADTSRLQREQQNAGFLALEDREVVLAGLLERASVVRAAGRIAEMEQVRLRRDRLSGQAGITKASSIVDHWFFLVSAIAGAVGDEAVNAHTGRGPDAHEARSTQDFATINRHAGRLPWR